MMSATGEPLRSGGKLQLEDRDWGLFKVTDLFKITGTTTTPLLELRTARR